MKQVDSIRTKLIDKILAIQNADFLKALDSLVSSTSQADKVSLSNEQLEMLEMSNRDIEDKKFISHSEFERTSKEWLKEK